MANPLPLQNMFDNGMKRDFARNRLPPNSVWGLKDFILNYGAPARERNGWSYASSDVSAITGTSSYIKAGIYATFSPTAGAQEVNLAIDEDGYVFKVALTGTPAASGVGQGVVTSQNPVFHGGTAASAATPVYTGLIIIPGDYSNVPKKYDGSSLTNLGGSPPKAKFASVFKDYTALANGQVGSTIFPNRVWWSPAGDPDVAVSGAQTAWDVTNSWNDFSLPIIGLGSTKNVFLVFGDGQIARVRGSVPPPNEDFVVDDPWQKIGLLDPFSITEYQDQIYFCAQEGVFATDGVSLNDLTLKGGMLRYWLDLVAGDTSGSYTYSTGIIRNKLLVGVMSGTAAVDAFMVDLQSYAWTRLTNFKPTSFWSGQYGNADETYFGLRNAPRVGRLNTMFDVENSAYKADADGTAVQGEIELPFYELGKPGIKTVKAVHIGYFLRDWATDNPTVACSYTTTPESTSYTSTDTLVENTTYNRVRVPLGGRMYGFGLKLTKSGAGDFHGFDFMAEVGYQEMSKRIQ